MINKNSSVLFVFAGMATGLVIGVVMVALLNVEIWVVVSIISGTTIGGGYAVGIIKDIWEKR